jgi:hypothetical protein
VCYKDVEKLKSTQFERLTGVKREVFEQMFEVLNEAKTNARKHPTRGTPPKLSNADKLLLLLILFQNLYRKLIFSMISNFLIKLMKQPLWSRDFSKIFTLKVFKTCTFAIVLNSLLLHCLKNKSNEEIIVFYGYAVCPVSR